MTGERARSGLSSALALLTVVGGPAAPSPAAAPWYPAVGALLGATLGVAWWGLDRVLPAFVGGAVVLCLDLALTGLLHADGLVDAADGLLPHLERARRLEVMREPATGAFGVTAALGVYAMRLAALASYRPAHAWTAVLLLGGMWAASRALMTWAISRLAYARPAGGLGALYGGSTGGGGRRGALVAAGAWVVALAALLAWDRTAGAPVLLAVLVGGGAVLALAVRRLGGYTGDVLGAAGVVGETLGLVVAVARW